MSAGTSEALADRLAEARARRGRRTDPSRTAAGVPRRPEGVLPLSSAQRRFWFVRQLSPDVDPFVVPVAVRLRGPVDVARLERAVLDLVARHAVLRTRIEELEGEPVAVLDPDPVGALEVRPSSPQRCEHDVREAAYALFDLAAEQPWRATLLQLGPDDAMFVLTLHHVAADGWSMGVVLDELGALYRGETLPGLTLDYADYAHFRTLPEGREGARIEHWVEHLRDAPPELSLPTDRPRRAGDEPVAAQVVHALSPVASTALSTVMAQSGCTAYMVLLAATHVVLGRWSGQDDLVLGTTVAGRTRREFEPLVGCFVGTLAVRTRSTPATTVRELLTQARDVTLDALAHQTIGYEEVVEAVTHQRTASMTGLYQASLTVHTEATPELDLPGVDATWVRVPSAHAQCDLALSAHGDLARGVPGGGLEVTAEWLRDLFDESTVRRMLGHLEQVLVEMAAGLDRPLRDLRMLTDQEWAALPALQGAGVEPARPRAARLEDLVWDWARRTPHAVAVTSRGRDLTYADLRASAAGVAAALIAAGVGAQARVALFTERSTDAVAGMLGILSAGAAYVPVDPMYPDSRCATILDTAGVTAVVTQTHLADRVPDGLRVVLVDDLDPADGPPAPSPVEPRPDALAYVLFTSGTTGAPKGVCVEHRQLLTYLDGARRVLGIEEGWAWATMSTLSADLGLTNVLGALTTGGRLHLLTYEQAVDPRAVADYFARHRIDAMKLVPSHLQALWDEAAPAAVLPARLLVLAGEPLPWALVDRIRAAAPDLAVHNHYGPTETTVSTMARPLATADDSLRSTGPVVPLGRPFPGTRAHVVDPLGRPVPVGVPGELVIAGPTVSAGYHGRPDLTAERFVPEPRTPAVTTGSEPTTAYRTGDRVRRLPTGDIAFLGRVDDQVKIRGYRVEPGEVARVVEQVEDVAECAVVLRTDGAAPRLVAYAVPRPGSATELPARVRQHLRAVLPDYMVPAAVVVLDALPLNANGKLDRAALPAPEPVTDATTAAPPSGETELRVARAWSEVLGLEAVGAEDSFFDCGGDSFSTVRLVRALDGAVGVVDVFAHPTVRALARLIDERASGADAAPTGLLRRLGRPATPGTTATHVVCVPFGGGSPVAFVPLAEAMPDGVVVHGVALPGHDTSRPEEENRDLDALADELVAEIRGLGGDVVLYGHCLGGALAIETALRLEAAGHPVLGVVEAGTFPAARLPGRLASWWHRVLPSDRLVSDRAYLETLRSLGGFTEDLDPADQAQLIRALRHDSREAESYYTARDALPEGTAPRLDAPVLCVVGERDRATELYEERFDEWREFADDVRLEAIPGAGHFFPRHQARELADLIVGHAARWRRGERLTTPPIPDGAARPSVRTFLLVALTQLLSMIGTGLTSFALGVWVLQQTGSVSAFATIAVMAVLPSIVALPFAGAVADRYDRRRVMLVSDAVAGTMTALLVGLLLLDQLSVAFVYVFAAVGSLANAFQRPAYLAAVTQLVPKRYLGQAGGLVSLGINAGDLIAALAGGVVIGLWGLETAVGIDVVTFLVAVTVLLAVRFPQRLWVRREEGFRAEVVGGWRYILARREMVAMVLFFVVFNYLFCFPVGLATPLVLAGADPATLGVVTATGGLGAVLGSLLMGLWGGTRRRALGMVGGTSVLGLAVVVLGLTPSPAWQAFGLAGVYGALLVVNAHWLALIQGKVGLELQGRVLSINQMLATAMMPLGFLSVGPVSEWVDTHLAGADDPLGRLVGAFAGQDGAGLGLTLVLTGVVLTVWGLLGLLWRPLRRMDLTLPDAVPDAVIASDKETLQRRADEALAAAASR